MLAIPSPTIPQRIPGTTLTPGESFIFREIRAIRRASELIKELVPRAKTLEDSRSLHLRVSYLRHDIKRFSELLDFFPTMLDMKEVAEKIFSSTPRTSFCDTSEVYNTAPVNDPTIFPTKPSLSSKKSHLEFMENTATGKALFTEGMTLREVDLHILNPLHQRSKTLLFAYAHEIFPDEKVKFLAPKLISLYHCITDSLEESYDCFFNMSETFSKENVFSYFTQLLRGETDKLYASTLEDPLDEREIELKNFVALPGFQIFYLRKLSNDLFQILIV
jgi:hypothetical protein